MMHTITYKCTRVDQVFDGAPPLRVQTLVGAFPVKINSTL